MRTDKITDPVGEIKDKFRRRYHTRASVVQAPGRVNLIGEHTDYNDGFVLPAAIQFQTSIAFAPREDGKLLLYSENYSEDAEFRVEELPAKARGHWSDYVAGIAQKLVERGTRLKGASLLIQGDVPQGAGLSSSASLEVAVCRALLEVSTTGMDGVDLARLCQRAENEFVGARCGIMDQFVAVHGKKEHALLLDCRSLEYHHLPIPEGIRLVICNTMVRHSVAGGEYNQRRKECEAGARFFAGKKPGVHALRDVSPEEFRKYGTELPEAIRKRCRHVIAENARVTQAADALGRQDLELFGRLMGESHASLRDDFQVSCEELDVMTELAGEVEGVYGARMTGAGFGGCTISLVTSERVAAFREHVEEGYARATGKRPEIYVCTSGDGVRVLA